MCAWTCSGVIGKAGLVVPAEEQLGELEPAREKEDMLARSDGIMSVVGAH